jgi:hypothetical protein
MAERLTADEVGVELPDLEAARSEAIQTIQEIFSETVLHGHTVEPHQQVEIADEARKLLMTVPFADAAKFLSDQGTNDVPGAEEQEDQPSKYWYAWFAYNQACLAGAAKARLR